MQIKIETKPAFSVAGILKKEIEASQCPPTWQELFETYPMEQLTAFGDGRSYGVCMASAGKGIDYLAGYQVSDKKRATNLGLTVLEFPEADYAVIPVTGAIPDSIHQAWRALYQEFFLKSGYKHSGAADFEVYSDQDPHSPDYQMELWVPVVRESSH